MSTRAGAEASPDDGTDDGPWDGAEDKSLEGAEDGTPEGAEDDTGEGAEDDAGEGAEDDAGEIVGAVTVDPGEISVVVSDGARRFIAEHGNQLYVWASSRRFIFPVTLLEASTERPPVGLAFRRRHVAGFDLMLQANRRVWPRTLDVDLCSRGRKVCAYWNGLAVIA
jgi:hypothetical protein